jgi:hypothetical protein
MQLARGMVRRERKQRAQMPTSSESLSVQAGGGACRAALACLRHARQALRFLGRLAGAMISVSSPQSQKSNHFFVHSPGQDASGRPLPVSMGRNLISKTCWGFDETRARADETADRPMRQAHLSNRGPWKSRGRKSHSQRSLSLAQNPNFALKIERGQVHVLKYMCVCGSAANDAAC